MRCIIGGLCSILRGSTVVLDVIWRFLLLTRNVSAWAFDAKFLHRDHQSTDELVAPLETQQLILPIGLVEEDNVHRNGVRFCDSADFREDIALIFTFLVFDKFEKALAEIFD